MLKLSVPEGENRVLLHACCAPCSTAIVECLQANGIQPVMFYFNPNIYPEKEYEIRRDEAKRFAAAKNIDFIEEKYDYIAWRKAIEGLEEEPERGKRCQKCFTFRLKEAVKYAREHGLKIVTTTLASSRWKSLEQICQAGEEATKDQNDIIFWEQNWRKGGLQDRRNQLLKEFGFYNQQYCGCEFSLIARQKQIAEREKCDEYAKKG